MGATGRWQARDARARSAVLVDELAFSVERAPLASNQVTAFAFGHAARAQSAVGLAVVRDLGSNSTY